MYSFKGFEYEDPPPGAEVWGGKQIIETGNHKQCTGISVSTSKSGRIT